MVQNPQPQSLPKGVAHTLNFLKREEVPASSQCYPRLCILRTAVSTVRVSPSLAGTGSVPTCAGEGSALPQPQPRVTALSTAGTLPIILVMMQNRLQPFPPCGAACQPWQQSHAGNWALGRSLFSAVTTYTHLKIHPPSRKTNPERCVPCQGFQQWGRATCR